MKTVSCNQLVGLWRGNVVTERVGTDFGGVFIYFSSSVRINQLEKAYILLREGNGKESSLIKLE